MNTTSHDPAPTGSRVLRGPFRPGDKVQLTDPRGRLNTIVLAPGDQFHTHKGWIEHDDLLGRPAGVTVHSTAGVEFQAMRPGYEDFVLSMPRGAAVIYPKDAALITTMGDVFPGSVVVEAGVGSGALTLALLRAVGDHGRVLSFERRQEFADIASGNIADFFGSPHPAWSCTVGDLAEELPRALEAGEADRVVLDMLAPWECVDVAADALTAGGMLIVYVATASQLSRTAEAVRSTNRFAEPRALESMVRDWHLEGLAVRPEHRMIGHTGFLLFARRMDEGVEPLERSRRPQGSTPDEEDLDAWFEPEITESAIGQRTAPPKRLRKLGRAAGSRARVEAAQDGAATDEAATEGAVTGEAVPQEEVTDDTRED
ncbi:MAG: tRNA (adenine-N1)-methyltransferase [Brevibacterium yomogidense]|nr:MULTISPECIES: tRNA (adenine-N1)-methyltransferase [Brevibacterium]SMX67169.1 tRNA (adenine-58-N(1)-) methyltransferase [Brevibacterium sp. Mu109]